MPLTVQSSRSFLRLRSSSRTLIDPVRSVCILQNGDSVNDASFDCEALRFYYQTSTTKQKKCFFNRKTRTSISKAAGSQANRKISIAELEKNTLKSNKARILELTGQEYKPLKSIFPKLSSANMSLSFTASNGNRYRWILSSWELLHDDGRDGKLVASYHEKQTDIDLDDVAFIELIEDYRDILDLIVVTFIIASNIRRAIPKRTPSIHADLTTGSAFIIPITTF